MNVTSLRPGTRRRISGTVAALIAATTLASCAAGQIAETANEKPSLDGTFGVVGKIQLEGVAIRAPYVPGRPSGMQYYVKGDAAPMRISLVNTGHSADTLTDVSSPAFTGWNIVSTSRVPKLPPSSSPTPGEEPPTTGTAVDTTVNPPSGPPEDTTSAETSPAPEPTPTGTAPTFSGGGHPVTVPRMRSVALGIDNLGYAAPDGTPATSPRTLVLTGLKQRRLYPGASVPVTFTFAKAGSKTLQVPVQVGNFSTRETVPAPPTPTAG